MKPVFVRKRDRVTIIEKEKELQKQKKIEDDQQRMAEERRRQTLRLVEETIKKEQLIKDKENNEPNINDVCTDDENDEIEYEAWKLRELKRIKRDREEREALEKEKMEIDRLRNMTEEERRIMLRYSIWEYHVLIIIIDEMKLKLMKFISILKRSILFSLNMMAFAIFL